MDPMTARKLLTEKMSDISERCWSASWMFETEYVLWQAVVDGPMAWGQGTITDEHIAALNGLAAEAGGWVVFHNLGSEDELFVPLKKWVQVYAIWAKVQKRNRPATKR